MVVMSIYTNYFLRFRVSVTPLSICISTTHFWRLVYLQNSIISMHCGIFGVLAVATLETIVWLVTYIRLNLTGEPYCCPFSGVVVFALVLQVRLYVYVVRKALLFYSTYSSLTFVDW